jgi:hypothetical protein
MSIAIYRIVDPSSTVRLPPPAIAAGMSTLHARGLRAATLVVAAAALLAGAAAANPNETVVLKATLTGRYLHSSSTGAGTATITFTNAKACWKFSYHGLDAVNVSGIHIAPPPTDGSHTRSVLPFTATTSTKPGCEALNRWGPSGPTWAPKIVAQPSHFYVIVGTDKYPNGAIGGALHR